MRNIRVWWQTTSMKTYVLMFCNEPTMAFVYFVWSRASHFFVRRYTSYDLSDNEHRLNVTVHKVNFQDYGVYICSARNEAGLVETNVTFDGGSRKRFFPFGESSGGDLWVVLFCLVVGKFDVELFNPSWTSSFYTFAKVGTTLICSRNTVRPTFISSLSTTKFRYELIVYSFKGLRNRYRALKHFGFKVSGEWL